MNGLVLYAVLIASPVAALADKPSCMSLEKVQAAAGVGTTVVRMTEAQRYFLEGIYALNPVTPEGLPPGDGALLLTKDNGDTGVVLWTMGPLVCNPMPAPKPLLDLLAKVKSGLSGGEF